MNNRILNKQEEQVIRLVHHEFGGLKPKEAAIRMGIPVRKVYSYLKSIKCKAPQLFPILTAEQFKVYKLLTEENMGYDGVASRLGCTPERVNKVVVRLHEKGFDTSKPRVIQFNESMETNKYNKIIRKF